MRNFSDTLYSSDPVKVNISAGTHYIALGDDGFDGAEYYVTAFAISAKNESQSLVSPAAPEKPAVPLTFQEITLPYSSDLVFTEENGAYNDYGDYFFLYKFTVSESGFYKFESDYDYSSPVPAHIAESEFTESDLGDFPFFGESTQYLEAGKTYYFSLGGEDESNMQFSISLTDDIKEVTLPYYHDGTEFTEKFSGPAPFDMYYDIYTFTLTEDKDVYIYGGNVNAGNEFAVAISDRFFTIADAIYGASGVTTYSSNDEPKKVSLTAGTYYIVLSDDGFTSSRPDYSYYSTVFSITFDENPDYLSVEEISKVGVEEGEADAVKAYGRRGSIVVSGAGDAEVKVFGVNGAPIYSGNGDAVIPALPGIYAVRVADKAFKVVVR